MTKQTIIRMGGVVTEDKDLKIALGLLKAAKKAKNKKAIEHMKRIVEELCEVR
jgi:hypothetical protein